MNQKFIIMLSRRASEPDVDAPLRALFAELKGCQLLSLVQRDDYVTITMLAVDVTDLVRERELRAFVSILTDRVRDLVRLESVRSIAVGGTLEHVNKILAGKKP